MALCQVDLTKLQTFSFFLFTAFSHINKKETHQLCNALTYIKNIAKVISSFFLHEHVASDFPQRCRMRDEL